jgi:hypothetical protein
MIERICTKCKKLKAWDSTGLCNKCKLEFKLNELKNTTKTKEKIK